MIVAIDGPAASGKGTIARRLAATFGLPHLDTGLLYRAVGYLLLTTGRDPANAAAAVAAAHKVATIDLADPALRGDNVAQAASIVAAIAPVRAELLGYQRRFAHQPGGAVLDGRDIGTVVCPEADAKIFVTATVQTRAWRRFRELQARGQDVIYAAVLQDMRERDDRDSGRAVAPLAQAFDAIVLDTSDLDEERAFQQALAFVRQKYRPETASLPQS